MGSLMFYPGHMISKSQGILCLIFRTDSGLQIYHLTWQSEFKSWTRLFTFHFGKGMNISVPQLRINSMADWAAKNGYFKKEN